MHRFPIQLDLDQKSIEKHSRNYSESIRHCLAAAESAKFSMQLCPVQTGMPRIKLHLDRRSSTVLHLATTSSSWCISSLHMFNFQPFAFLQPTFFSFDFPRSFSCKILIYLFRLMVLDTFGEHRFRICDCPRENVASLK